MSVTPSVAEGCGSAISTVSGLIIVLCIGIAIFLLAKRKAAKE